MMIIIAVLVNNKGRSRRRKRGEKKQVSNIPGVVFDLITPIDYNKSTRSFLKVAYFYIAAAVRIRTPCGIVKRSGENN
jgi:hypothetical protein